MACVDWWALGHELFLGVGSCEKGLQSISAGLLAIRALAPGADCIEEAIPTYLLHATAVHMPAWQGHTWQPPAGFACVQPLCMRSVALPGASLCLLAQSSRGGDKCCAPCAINHVPSINAPPPLSPLAVCKGGAGAGAALPWPPCGPSRRPRRLRSTAARRSLGIRGLCTHAPRPAVHLCPAAGFHAPALEAVGLRSIGASGSGTHASAPHAPAQAAPGQFVCPAACRHRHVGGVLLSRCAHVLLCCPPTCVQLSIFDLADGMTEAAGTFTDFAITR